MIISDLKVLCHGEQGEDDYDEDFWIPFIVHINHIVAVKQYGIHVDKSVIYTISGHFIVNKPISELEKIIRTYLIGKKCSC